MDFQLWETKDKAIYRENGGALGRASFILSLGVLPGSCQKCSSLYINTQASKSERDNLSG